MPPPNVPDDWNMYWYRCWECGQRYHGSEGGHDCPEGERLQPKRDWLEDSGYEFDADGGLWSIVVNTASRTARRDHKDGRIKKGQRYRVSVSRHIDDGSGKSWHEHTKNPIIGG
jgi:hypothetical protein